MWIDLFDGETTKGWKNLDGTEPTEAFTVDDNGCLYRHQGGGDIYYAERTFADFELEVEWKISPKGNSGIFIRVSNPKEVWQTGLEMQVLDDDLHADGQSEITSAGSIGSPLTRRPPEAATAWRAAAARRASTRPGSARGQRSDSSRRGRTG